MPTTQPLYPFPLTFQVPASVLRRRRVITQPTVRNVTWAWDPEARDFARDAGGDVPLTDAREAAIVWAAKAVTTQRGQYLIYSRGYGADLARSLQAGSRDRVEAALAAEMRRAARRDVRIADLRDFQFRWFGATGLSRTTLEVAYSCVLADGAQKQTFVRIGLQ